MLQKSCKRIQKYAKLHLKSDILNSLKLTEECQSPTDVLSGVSQGITSFPVMQSTGLLYEMPHQPLLCLGFCWHSHPKALIV